MKRLLGVAWAVASVAAAGGAAREPLVREAYLMGTRVTVSTWADDRSRALDTLNTAITVLEDVEAELSTWRQNSAVSQLNRHPIGRPYKMRPALCAMLDVVFEWHAATAGAFDPAIGRLTDAWGIHAGGRVPPAAILSQARQMSGLPLLTFDRMRCEVTRRSDVTIDVGAFGKGAALDRVKTALGGAPWLVDLGGQVSVHGTPPGQPGWQVAIAHPLERQRPVVGVILTRGSLSTSAGAERDVTVDGRRIGHILDPRLGSPATFGGSVTVWHESALVADILSTALFVMGPEDGFAWAESRGVAACFLTAQPGSHVSRRMTRAFAGLTSVAEPDSDARTP